MTTAPLPTLDDIRNVAEEIDEHADVSYFDDGCGIDLDIIVGSLTINITADHRSSALRAAYGALVEIRDNDRA